MKRRFPRVVLVLLLIVLFPRECPAPLVYRPGEGWSYETPGQEVKWTRKRASAQLEVAQQAFDDGKYGLAIKAARRTLKVWPLSDYAADAQYLLAYSYQKKGRTERAFKEYEKLLAKHPKFGRYDEVLQRQFEIANRYLDGKWFRLWGTIPLYRSMDKTAKMFESIVKNGPYSRVGPQAQMSIGTAREKQADFFNRDNAFAQAVTAYLVAVDRYFDNPEVAADALYLAGNAYFQQAKKADYDQSVAGKAIDTFTDFIALYPQDPRVPEAQTMVVELKTEQARGNFSIARFYEKRKRWNGALIYYNEVLAIDDESPYAEEARNRMDTILRRHGQSDTNTEP